MARRPRGYGSTLAFSIVVSALACSTRPARAECGDFGGLGVMIGATGGLSASVVGGFLYPGVARIAKPELRYWPGVAYTLAAGATGTVFGTLAISGECPYPESMYVPALVAAPLGAFTTLIWAAAGQSKPPPVAVMVAPPRSGDGAVLTLGRHF